MWQLYLELHFKVEFSKLLSVHLQTSGEYLWGPRLEPPPAGDGKTAPWSQGRMDGMQNGKSYETVLVAIAQAKNWQLFGLLKKLKFEDRIAHIENAFLEAAEQCDDTAALQFFKWLMDSIRDRELECVLKPTKRYLEHFELPYSAEADAAEKNAARSYAQKAQELYVKLPAYEAREVRPFERDPEIEKFPTLLQTRDAMLQEISARCFETRDEAESDALFSFLLAVKLNNDNERKKYSDALENATNKSVSLGRLARHFERVMNNIIGKKKLSGFGACVDREEGIAKTLGKAWLRNLIIRRWKISKEKSGRYKGREGLEHLFSCMKVLEPLMNASGGAIELLERFSRTVVAPTDALTDGLIQIMREERGNSIPPLKVRGDIAVGYGESINHLAIVIDITEYDIYGDEKKQELFILAKMRANEWIEKYRFKIHLEVINRNKFASQEEKESGKDVTWRYAEDI